MIRSVLVLLAVSLAGCSSTGSYDRYVSGQAAVVQAAIKGQQPLLRIIAQPGQAITGLASIEVYGPLNLPRVEQERPNEWVPVAAALVAGATTGYLQRVSSRASVSMAEIAVAGATHGYQHVQAPGAVTSTVINTTDSHDITGSYNPVDSTHAPTVVTAPAPEVVVIEQPVFP